MRVRYEDLLDLANLERALLELVLGSLAAVKEPDVCIQTQREGGVVTRR